MPTIFVLFTMMMGTLQGISVHKTKAECESHIAMQKAAGIMDVSKMQCIEYKRKN